MINKKPIQSRAENLLDSLNEKVTELSEVRELLDSSLYSYLSNQSIENELKLKAAVLLADSFTRNKVGIDSFEHVESDRFSVAIQGDWRSHEFSRAFESFNQIYQLVFFEEVSIRRLRNSEERLDTRHDVYREAKLHYYINNNEALKVNRINYNSPGEIEFLTKVAEYAPELIKHTLLIIAVSKFAPQFVMNLSSAYRKLMEDIFHVRDLRRINSKERMKGKIDVFVNEFCDRTLPKVAEKYIIISDNQKRKIVFKAVEELRKKFKNISNTDIVNTAKVIENTIEALRTLAISENNDKLSLPILREAL